MILVRTGGNASNRIDIDTIRFINTTDSDLSDYLDINIDATNHLIDFLSKVGDFRFKDADDSDNSDVLKLVNDDASGSLKQSTSQITDGAIWEIESSGTYSGASATVDIDYFLFDLDGTTINDAATNAVTLQGINMDFDGITATAVTLSEVNGAVITLPTTGAYASTKGLIINASNSDAAILYGMHIITAPGLGDTNVQSAMLATDGINNTYLCNGSVGISSEGINEEKYYKCEDFDEEAAAVTLAAGLRADEWIRGGVNDADANTTYIQDQGGVLQIVTNGADDDSHEITWLGTTINIASNPILEFRVQIDAVTANLSGFFVGVTETRDIQTINDISAVSDDYLVVGMNSDLADPSTVRIWSEDDNGGQVIDKLTGTTITGATWVTIRIDLTDTEQPRVFINNTGGAITPAHEIAAASITGTVQDSIYVMPVIFVQCLDATPSARTLLIDYVKAWQDRS